MPLPLLIGGAILLAGVGVKKGYDATELNDKAERIVNRAKSDHYDANERLELKQEETNTRLETLGEFKIKIFTTDIHYLVEAIKRCKDSANSEYLSKKIFTEQELNELNNSVNNSLEIQKGLASGAAAGALTGLGAYGAVGALASASTGTAIAGLSGAAATNATLAWLGGGSLAAGGGGMALGTMVLGGLVAGPLLAVGGFVMNSAAEENLTQAREYEEDVDIKIEEMNKTKSILKSIRGRASEVEDAILEISNRFNQLVVNIEQTRRKGNRSPPLNRLKSICRGITRITRKSGLLKVVFRVFQRDSVAKYAFNFKGYEQIRRKESDFCKSEDMNKLIVMGKALKNLLDIPVLDENGKENIRVTSEINQAITLE